PALARAVAALPAQTLLLDRGGLRLGPDMVGGARPVGLAEGVATADQRHGLLVVHRHPAERLPDVPGSGERVRFTVRALRVDVDEAHLRRGVRLVEFPVTAVALAAEPGGLRA